MLAAQSPLSSHHHNQLTQRSKSNRKPLQPSNTPISNNKNNPKQKPNSIEVSNLKNDNSNKENVPPIYSTPLMNESFQIQSFDTSLAEELSAIREKLERLSIEKTKTEKMLKDRDLMLDSKMKEILHRGEVQKMLEIEVDRLYRLNEIRLACLRVSPLRSLREKEQEKKMKQDQLIKTNIETKELYKKDESPFQCPDTED